MSTPSPKSASAPQDQFSAGRAFAHIEKIGQQVHVAGSSAADGVRDYIDTTLQGYGLHTQVQDAVGGTDALGGTYAMARVRNLIAVLPGTNSTGRLFLVAHYDSVQVSYGANDDGAGVATLLETARILSQGPRPRNDVVFVFTDAEEACLCGAEAFVDQDPLAADGGVVLNFEARGSSGPVVMFETSRANAGVVGVYADAVPYPVATSFAVEVYRILPNDTDFTPFRESGRFTGLNSAYIDGSAVYHSPEDRPSYMDKGSLQMHGDNGLALARAFGSADLGTLSIPSAGDSTYFPFLGFLVRYPGWLVWPFAVLALLAVIALGWFARRRRLTSAPRAVIGFAVALGSLIVTAVLAQLTWTVLTLIRPSYAPMIDPWRPGWFRFGVVAVATTVVLCGYGMLRRRLGSWSLIIGGLGLLLGLRFGSWVRYVAPAVAAALAIPILAPTVLLFFPALGLATGAAAAVFTLLVAYALLPVIEWVYPQTEGVKRRWNLAPAGVAAILAIACLATGLAVDGFDQAHPRPSQLMYALDSDTNKAYWVSEEDNPTQWTQQYLTGHDDLKNSFPILATVSGTLSTGPAQAATLPAPELTVESDSQSGSQRTVTLLLKPQRSVRLVDLSVSDKVTVVRATAAGRAVPDSVLKSDTFNLMFNAPPPEGVTITLVLDASGPVDFRAMDGSDGLTDLPGFHARPADVGVQGSHQSELVLVSKSYHL